jgi:hypothetical protein
VKICEDYTSILHSFLNSTDEWQKWAKGLIGTKLVFCSALMIIEYKKYFCPQIDLKQEVRESFLSVLYIQDLYTVKGSFSPISHCFY